MASFEVFLRKNGLLVASLRLATALILLVMGLTDTGEMGLRPELDDYAFLAYFAWTVALLILCIASWEWSYSVTAMALAVDVVMFLLIPHAKLPHESDILIGTTVLGALSIVKVGLRWGPRPAINMAIALNFICIFNCGIMFVMREHAPELYFRQIVIFAITSIIAIWASYRITPPKLPVIRLEGAIFGRGALDELLKFSMKAMNCRRGIFVWMNEEEDVVPLKVSRNWQRVDVSTDVLSSLLWPVDAPFKAIMIGGRRGMALRTDKTGRLAQVRFDHSLAKIIPSLQKQTIFIAKIKGPGGDGVMVLSDAILPEADDVLLLEDVTNALERALEKLMQAEMERSAAVHGTREAIARDLHDSVAQSLAGAKFHLAALLRSDLPPNVSIQISKLKDAIDQEHTLIRDYIDDLQSKSAAPDNLETQRELEELCRRLESTWNVTVELVHGSDFNPTVRIDLLEIQQIVREAVANAVRHGQASHIKIRCAANDLGMQLSISDNGIGMKPDLVLNAPKSIKARITALRGTLKVMSKGTGVELQMFIPMGAGN